jgi:UDP:flavonoid glycosyltransferase YjiC (YdhE family)
MAVSLRLPGHLLARRAAVVISNGGSTTGYQVLSEGKPVLGMASNPEQYLAMQSSRAGRRENPRERTQCGQELAERGIHELLTNPCYTNAAQALRAEFERFPAQHRFASFIESATSASQPAKCKPEAKWRSTCPAVDESAGD